MSWLLGNTAVAAVMAVVVLLLSRWLRAAPAVSHVLWCLVLLKLAMPPLFALPIDLPWVQAVPTPVRELPRQVLPPLRHESMTAGLGDAERVPVATTTQAADSLAARLAPTPTLPPTTTSVGGSAVGAWAVGGWAVSDWTVGDWALGLWGTGSALLVAFAVGGLRRCHRRVAALRPAPVWLQREIAAIADRLGVRPPLLLDDPSATSPFLWSCLRTRLLVPSALLAATSVKGRAAVLAHELAHLRRGDHVVAHLEMLLAAVLWWHPLFWFARNRLRLAAELACDAWAVAVVPGATLDYADVLITSVTQRNPADSGLAVLAARPAARAAFERRLMMILSDTVPCRLSRSCLLPLTALGLFLFASPVAAQGDDKPVRIEVKVNGQNLKDLDPAERREVLERLLQQENESAPKAKSKAKQEPKQKPKAKAKVESDADSGGKTPSADEVHDQVQQGLAEAKREVMNDPDLKELGITNEVGQLIDSIGGGGDFEGSLEAVIKAAMKGAGRMAVKEIRQDPELKKLGLDDSIEKLVTGLLSDERNQEMLLNFAKQAMHSAAQEAKTEIRADKDLKRLGITGDVEALVDSMLSGKGDFDGSLQRLIEKAMKAGMQQAGKGGDSDDDSEDAAPAPAPKPKPKAAKAKKAKEEIR